MSVPEPDDRRGLRLNHAELVPSHQHNTLVGMAWDAYLEAAARIHPEVLESLLTVQIMGAGTDDPGGPGPHSRGSERELVIMAWCRHWGFRTEYAFNPAWNTLNSAKEARRSGQTLPTGFVCTCSGQWYSQWEIEGRQQLGGVGVMPIPDDDEVESWNPDGTPHPFPELPGRLMAHGRFTIAGGNGVQPFPAQHAARQGTQVMVQLPMLYWDPTAETRAEAHARIIESLGTLLDADLDTIEQAYRANGYQSPPEKRTPDHFEWLVRYQLLRESKRDIARAVGVSERHLRRELGDTARLLGIPLRGQRRGRPRRPTSRTVKLKKSGL